jgi:NAD-dependent DNA ligase
MQHPSQIPSAVESRTEIDEKHQFKRQSFLIPTICVYCDNRVWTGLKRSAFQCQSTSTNCMAQCAQAHHLSHFKKSSFFSLSIFLSTECGGAIHKKCLNIGEGSWGVCKPTDIARYC